MYELSATGKVLKNLRDSNHLTVRGQAADLGIAPSYLVDIQYGNRELSYTVFKKILTAYGDTLSEKDFISLGIALNSPDVYQRYKEITHTDSDLQAIKEFTYIVTGETLRSSV